MISRLISCNRRMSLERALGQHILTTIDIELTLEFGSAKLLGCRFTLLALVCAQRRYFRTGILTRRHRLRHHANNRTQAKDTTNGRRQVAGWNRTSPVACSINGVILCINLWSCLFALRIHFRVWLR